MEDDLGMVNGDARAGAEDFYKLTQLWHHQTFIACSGYDSALNHRNTVVPRGPRTCVSRYGFQLPGFSLLL